MDHVDLGIGPGETDSQTFVVPLKKDIRSVGVEATFSYIYEEGQKIAIHKVNKKVEFTKK